MSKSEELAKECQYQTEYGNYERSLFRQCGEELRRLQADRKENMPVIEITVRERVTYKREIEVREAEYRAMEAAHNIKGTT